jgi:hypothetical protein
MLRVIDANESLWALPLINYFLNVEAGITHVSQHAGKSSLAKLTSAVRINLTTVSLLSVKKV